MTAARVAAALAGQLSRTLGLGAGQNVAGRLALRWEPEILGELSRSRVTLLVSGTNGKTTTTRMLAEVVALTRPVVSNATGSNLQPGLVAALLGADEGTTAVLEVDEVVLPAALAACKPSVVALLNLSRDQLDRTSEVAGHAGRWLAALRADDRCTIVANADDPTIVHAVRQARGERAGILWVGAGQPWRDDAAVCPACGSAWDATLEDWSCCHCGARRPTPDWQLRDGRALAHGVDVPLDLQLPGRANQANAIMALAAAAALGIKPEVALPALRELSTVEGRYARTQVGNRDVRLLLAKNPAGWQELLHPEDALASRVIIAFNAREADGRDPSWLYDVPLGLLRKRQVVVVGERATDVSVRLHYAGVEHRTAVDLRQALSMLPSGDVDVVANYTAFTKVRRSLARRA